MTNIQKYNKKEITLLKIERKQSEMLVLLDQVGDKIRNTDKLICKISSRSKVIKSITDIELQDEINGLVGKLSFISKTIGLREIPDTAQMTSNFAFIVNYYSEFTLEEIQKAFEFAYAGELDEYLPTDKNNKPDAEHYQDFGIKYIGKILNAYRKRKHKAVGNIWKCLPAPEKTYSKEELKAGNLYWKKNMIEQFDLMITGGTPKFYVLKNVINFLIENELIKPDYKLSKKSKKQAFNERGRKGTSDVINNTIRKMFEKGELHESLSFVAWNIEEFNLVVNCFKKLIKEEKHIKDYL